MHFKMYAFLHKCTYVCTNLSQLQIEANIRHCRTLLESVDRSIYFSQNIRNRVPVHKNVAVPIYTCNYMHKYVHTCICLLVGICRNTYMCTYIYTYIHTSRFSLNHDNIKYMYLYRDSLIFIYWSTYICLQLE